MTDVLEATNQSEALYLNRKHTLRAYYSSQAVLCVLSMLRVLGSLPSTNTIVKKERKKGEENTEEEGVKEAILKYTNKTS